jgi:hypothetical protein
LSVKANPAADTPNISPIAHKNTNNFFNFLL